jgi:cytochrome c553
MVKVSVVTLLTRNQLAASEAHAASAQSSAGSGDTTSGSVRVNVVPICASCKKIRNDKGYWSQLETYISERSEAEFSHGLCQECARTLYPEVARDLG